MNTRRIVVGYDLSSDAADAARWAFAEAGRTGAPVELFYAHEWPVWAPAAPYVPGGAIRPDAEAAVKESLLTALGEARQAHPELHITLRTADTDAGGALVERSAGSRLVVLGGRGHSAVANLLGSVGVAVTAHAHCPVVVVRGRPAGDAPVVAGVDGSPASEAALGFAAEQAAARGVPLRVLQAPTPAADPVAGDLAAAWREKYPRLTITAEVVAEHPAAALARASTTAQLLVVGSRGRGPLRGMLLGSVSQHLLRHSACSIAVVHESMA